MITKIILTILVMLMASCGQLPIDPSPAPIDYDHYTLEMNYRGIKDVGLLGYSEDLGTELTTNLVIPVWGKGEISIASKRCNFSKTVRYGKKVRSVKFKITDMIKDSGIVENCIFNIYLFIEGFDRGFQGQFFLVNSGTFSPLDFTILNRRFTRVGGYQFSDFYDLNFPIVFSLSKPGKLFYSGCGVSGERKFEGNTSILVKEVLKEKKSCVVSFGVLYDDGGKALADISLKVFSKNLIEISDPEIIFRKGKLKIIAAKPVGVVGINGKVVIGRKIKRKVGNNIAWARMATAIGRYKLLGIKEGEVVWRASIKY